MYICILFTLLNVCEGFYVPIETSSSINRVYRSIKLADSTIVLGRNSTGHPVGFQDYCPHRGASFDKATLKDDNTINCPYHNFGFDTQNGKLTSGLGVKPGCSSLNMIDCVDRSGLVWGCIDGNDSIKPPPELKCVSDPTFRKISGFVLVKTPVKELVSNVVDPYHISKVHSFGNRVEPEPLNYKANKVSEIRGVATFQYNTGETSLFNGIVDVINWYDIPYTAGTSVRSGTNVKIVQVHCVELSNGYTKVFWELYRNFSIDHFYDSFFDMAMRITLNEDKEILEKCSFENGYKFHSLYDKLQILYLRSFKNCNS